MFICKECGHVFSEPGYYEESRPYGEADVYETFSCCPCCKGDYEEAVQCECCEEYFSKDEMEYNDICPTCIESYQKKIAKSFVEMFSEEEVRTFPDDMFEDKFWNFVEEAFKKEGNK